MSLQNAFNKNLLYVVDYEYDRNYPGWEGCTCPEYDYCRCTVIENIRASTPYTPTFLIARAFASEIAEQRGVALSMIQQYALERFLRIKLGRDGLDFNTCGGYYGDEMDSIYVNNRDRLWAEYQPLLNCTDDAELIRMVLLLDYGHIPESIQGFTRAFVDIADLQSIEAGNREYLGAMDDRDTVETYAKQWFKPWNITSLDTDIPLCVCRKSGDALVLVDGYHRYSALSTRGSKNVAFFVIVLE
jgi:hypothetical protein